jgi:hypothetical protein
MFGKKEVRSVFHEFHLLYPRNLEIFATIAAICEGESGPKAAWASNPVVFTGRWAQRD